MSDIPAARQMLEALQDRARSDGLHYYASEIGRIIPLLWRTAHKNGRARAQSTPSTPQLRAQIREYVRQNPSVPSQDVANRFGVNLGRVSEALAEGN